MYTAALCPRNHQRINQQNIDQQIQQNITQQIQQNIITQQIQQNITQQIQQNITQQKTIKELININYHNIQKNKNRERLGFAEAMKSCKLAFRPEP